MAFSPVYAISSYCFASDRVDCPFKMPPVSVSQLTAAAELHQRLPESGSSLLKYSFGFDVLF